jgi:hypothetical protein
MLKNKDLSRGRSSTPRARGKRLHLQPPREADPFTLNATFHENLFLFQGSNIVNIKFEIFGDTYSSCCRSVKFTELPLYFQDFKSSQRWLPRIPSSLIGIWSSIIGKLTDVSEEYFASILIVAELSLLHSHTCIFHCPEYGDDMFLRNVGCLSRD